MYSEYNDDDDIFFEKYKGILILKDGKEWNRTVRLELAPSFPDLPSVCLVHESRTPGWTMASNALGMNSSHVPPFLAMQPWPHSKVSNASISHL